jgi:hypothetical protein
MSISPFQAAQPLCCGAQKLMQTQTQKHVDRGSLSAASLSSPITPSGHALPGHVPVGDKQCAVVRFPCTISTVPVGFRSWERSQALLPERGCGSQLHIGDTSCRAHSSTLATSSFPSRGDRRLLGLGQFMLRSQEDRAAPRGELRGACGTYPMRGISCTGAQRLGSAREGFQRRRCSSVQHEGSSSPPEHMESRPCACLHRSG